MSDEKIRSMIATYAIQYNVVVIVPSKEKAEEWKQYSPTVVDKSNILDATDILKNSKGNLMVFINRYDGVDLIGDSCRILVLDGLSLNQSVREKYVSISRQRSSFFNANIAQTIEQGLGRAVRSGSDYCTVFILDHELLKFIGTRVCFQNVKE